mgnify:FL=1|tara:strand:+ start:1089 stop:1298 length:210 start_codon:yes stop_codon:yes gene_type:complete
MKTKWTQEKPSIDSKGRTLLRFTKEEYQQLENREKQLEWFNHFVDYVNQQDAGIYNDACEYADECEKSI